MTAGEADAAKSIVAKSVLLGDREMPTGVVELPIGAVVVRALTRAESKEMAELGEKDGWSEADRMMIVMGMVDPAVTLVDVKRWEKHSPAGELEQVALAIRDLSGMGEEARAAEANRFRE